MIQERGGSFILGSITFLANAIPSVAAGIEGWFPVLVQSGALGLLAFVLWNLFGFIHRMQEGSKESIKDLGRILDEQRTDFAEALKEHRAETREAMREFVLSLRDKKP